MKVTTVIINPLGRNSFLRFVNPIEQKLIILSESNLANPIMQKVAVLSESNLVKPVYYLAKQSTGRMKSV